MKPNLGFYIVLAALWISSTAGAEDVTIPNIFVSGTPARASEVNANFDALATAINSKAESADVISLGNSVNGKVDKSGDTMTGDLTVPRVVYSSPRTHTYAVSGDTFRPRTSAVEYSSGLGNGGAWISTAGSTQPLMAQANLPHGATITGITYYLHDNDASNDLRIYTTLQNFTGGYSHLHSDDIITSVGASTSTQVFSVVPTAGAVVNNATRSIIVWVFPAAGSVWTSNQFVRGVAFTYTLSEAQ